MCVFFNWLWCHIGFFDDDDIRSICHSFIHSFILCVSFIHSCIHSFCVSFIHSFIHSFCVFHSFIQRSSTDFLCECRSFCLFHSFIHSVFHSFIHSFCVSFIQLTQEYFAVNSNFCTSSFPYALIHVLIANNNEAAEQQQRGNPEEDEAAIAAAAALVAASHQQRRRSSEEALRYVFLTETRVGGGEADSYVLRSPDHFEIRNGRGQRHKIMKKCDRPTDGQKRVVKSRARD